MLVGQSLVVEAKQMQHGGMQIVNGDRFFDRSKTELIGRPMDRSAPDPTAGQP